MRLRMSAIFSAISCAHPAVALFCLLLACSTCEAACTAANPEALLASMKKSYAKVQNYRTDVEVEDFREGEPYETKRFLYTFRKPDHIRIVLESPHRGTVLIYPDKHGNVLVHLRWLFGYITLHLSPDNFLLEDSSGQKINQTDMGLLIRNISHSLTDQRRGKERITEEDGYILISVVAENHFIKGKITHYRFFIDKKRCLPVKIEESTPGEVPQRTIIFRNLTTNIDVGDTRMNQRGGEK